MTPYSGHFGEISSFNPRTYYTQQLRGSSHYPIYQSGRGLGSRLFKIATRAITKNRNDISRPPARLRQTLTFVFRHFHRISFQRGQYSIVILKLLD